MAKLLLKVELIPHSQQRYETCGDWIVEEDGSLTIRVSDTGKTLDALLVGLHEAVEAILCREAGVTQRAVDDFDMGFLGKGEPGEDPNAPYRKQHLIADVVERLVAAEAGVSWPEYELRICSLFEEGA